MPPTVSSVRAANRSLVVDVLRREGSATRERLIAATGLSRATVSSLVAELQEEGLVSESRSAATTSQGRPPTRLSLDRAAGLAIGVDVGVRHLAVAVGDLSRQVRAERWVSLPQGHGPDAGASMVLRCIEETLDEAEVDPAHLVGAAISMAAPVAAADGHLMTPHVLPGWDGHQLALLIGERWNIPAAVENDANLGALGEYTWGDFQGSDSVLYVKLASRLGLGIVLDGSIYHGAQGSAGEFGHITVDPEGERCWCGRRGCLETVVGGESLLRRLDLPTAGDVDLRAIEFSEDPETRRIVHHAAAALAGGLSTLALLFNPSAVVIGGELAGLGGLLLDPARQAMRDIPFGRPVPVTMATLNERASVAGALALVLGDSARFTDHASAPARARPRGRGAQAR